MIKRWWRWLTYKRVLIVYNADWVSQETLAKAMGIMEGKYIDPIALRVYGPDNTAIQLWSIDYLTQVEYEWVRKEIARLYESPVPIMDPEIGKREAVKDFAEHVERGHKAIQTGIEATVEAFKSERYRNLSVAEPKPNVIDPKELL